jgi:DUF4097 and DUF4098 domain-containing protein YvlB
MKEKTMKKLFAAQLAVLFVAGILVYGQEANTERAVVPFSNPSKPGRLEVDVYRGGITVKGYEGKEVIVEARVREKAIAEKEEQAPKEKGGLTRLTQIGPAGLSVEEENNVMSVEVESMQKTVDLSIQVPYATSLYIEAYTGGDIVVEKITGEIEAENYAGAIRLTDISGTVVADSYAGEVKVTFVKVTPDKPMSFSTWSGDIDVTLPADIKANVKMKSDNGEIYSDFNIALGAAPRKAIVEDTRKEDGKYRLTFDSSMLGTINGGGPEYQFTNYSGNIYIRKGK